mmetsp:Transcript_31175/g.81160  ORF Transcript_31175/g.81160 Transcript_31175/m.81160 type:complete len:390 (+) Transcript_31175:2884-4053(+)
MMRMTSNCLAMTWKFFSAHPGRCAMACTSVEQCSPMEPSCTRPTTTSIVSSRDFHWSSCRPFTAASPKSSDSRTKASSRLSVWDATAASSSTSSFAPAPAAPAPPAFLAAPPAPALLPVLLFPAPELVDAPVLLAAVVGRLLLLAPTPFDLDAASAAAAAEGPRAGSAAAEGAAAVVGAALAPPPPPPPPPPPAPAPAPPPPPDSTACASESISSSRFWRVSSILVVNLASTARFPNWIANATMNASAASRNEGVASSAHLEAGCSSRGASLDRVGFGSSHTAVRNQPSVSSLTLGLAWLSPPASDSATSSRLKQYLCMVVSDSLAALPTAGFFSLNFSNNTSTNPLAVPEYPCRMPLARAPVHCTASATTATLLSFEMILRSSRLRSP